jgi:oxidoreductase
MASPPRAWRACVIGATGATGRELVLDLLRSPAWASVTTIGRRPLEHEALAAFTSKLQQHVVPVAELGTTAPFFEGCDAAFIALGTTRKDAGSAEAFRALDHDAVVAVAGAAKASGVKHVAYISSVGADANSWFLYPKTKGQVEEHLKVRAVTACLRAVARRQAMSAHSNAASVSMTHACAPRPRYAQGLAFPSLAIMRPGLLDRGDAARPVERAMSWLTSGLPVAGLARATRLQAEAALAALPPTPTAVTLPDAQIRKLLASQPPAQ